LNLDTAADLQKLLQLNKGDKGEPEPDDLAMLNQHYSVPNKQLSEYLKRSLPWY
jgi:hypothetical protein